MKRQRASITVFMSLCMAACMLFITTVFESARQFLLQNKLEGAVELAMDSLFAEYDGDLFEEFTIFAMNTDDVGEKEMLAWKLEQYVRQMIDQEYIGAFAGVKEVSVTVKNETVLTSELGTVFQQDVLDYMKYRIPAEGAKKIVENLQRFEQAKNVEAEKKEKETEFTTEVEQMDQEKYDALLQDGIWDKINAIREHGFVELIVPTTKMISDRSDPKFGFPSTIERVSAWQLDSKLKKIENDILFCEYLLDSFGDFTNVKKNAYLDYELEYILTGKNNDKENLTECIEQLLGIREVLNIAAILTIPQLNEQADALATRIAGWTGQTAVIGVVKYLLVGAWAFGESIVDVRTLLSGSKVEFIKKKEDWSLQLDRLSDLAEGVFLDTGPGKSGMSYKDYLRMLLVLCDDEKKTYRAMDMLQGRMRERKPGFFINRCIYSLEIEVTAVADPVFLYSVPFQKKDVYRLKTKAARMY